MTVPGLESGHTILQLLGNRFGVSMGRVATTITRVTSIYIYTLVLFITDIHQIPGEGNKTCIESGAYLLPSSLLFETCGSRA